MTVHRMLHGEIDSYLRAIGTTAVFARYVTRLYPDGDALAVVRDNEVVGVVVGSVGHSNPEAGGDWLFAEGSDIAAALVAEHRRGCGSELSLSYSHAHADAVAPLVDDCEVSIDRMYVARHVDAADWGDVVRLDARALASLHIEDALTAMIGRCEDWGPGSHLYGIVHDGRLVAIAEATVRDDRAAAIQQVYTLPSHRRMGHARALVGRIAWELLELGLQPVYLVSESNAASIGLVEVLGFETQERWCHAER